MADPGEPDSRPSDETVDLPQMQHRTRGAGSERAREREPMPTSVGGYEVLEELGRGGMAIVYRARDPGVGTEVALKVLRTHDALSVEDRLRFQREAHAAARLRSPNIVRVFDWGTEAERAFLVMDLVRGESLKSLMERGPLDPPQAVKIVQTLARTLEFAHRRDVVHRDVKPGNIMLDMAGEPLLADFGLAKAIGNVGSDLTSTGQVLGTPAYMAPEQARGSNRLVGPPADIYALGATFYELLTGDPPFLGDSPLEILRAVSEDDPVPPSQVRPGLDPRLDAIVLTCLAKAPTDRYPSCEALAADLRRFLRDDPIMARLPSTEELVHRSIRSGTGHFAREVGSFLGGFDPAYADHAEQLLEHFANLLREISLSIVNDGQIDASETRMIRGEWERLKAYTEAFVSGCEEGVFGPLDEPPDDDPTHRITLD